MSAEVLRNTLFVAAALMQIGAVGFGVWGYFLDQKISANGEQGLERRHKETVSKLDSLRCDVQRLGISAAENEESSAAEIEQQLKKLSVQDVEKLLEDLRVQRKLLQDAFERTTTDGDYIHDLSTRLNCLIGTDDGMLYLVMKKLDLGMSCYDKFDPEKKRYELKDFFQRKNYKATVDGVQSAYSVQDIIHLLAIKGGGARIDLTVDEAFRRLTNGVKFGSHDAGAYILLRTAKQLLGDIDLLLDTAEKYYIKPMKLILRGDALKQQGNYDAAIVAFNDAKRILSEYRASNSHYLIQIEINLSAVYHCKKEYSKALEHAEKGNELLGDKEWTGNLAPICKEGIAMALLNLNIPSQSDSAKAKYLRSVTLLNEAIRLKKKNPQYEQTPLFENYDLLALAYLFLDDYVSALDSAQKAQELHPCQRHSIKEGLALVGLGRLSEANKLFYSVRSTDPQLTDALIEYSNNLAQSENAFHAADVWAFMR